MEVVADARNQLDPIRGLDRRFGEGRERRRLGVRELRAGVAVALSLLRVAQRLKAIDARDRVAEVEARPINRLESGSA